MEIIIFFKAIGNLFFAAVLLVALLVTSLYSLVFFFLKEMKVSELIKRNSPFRKAW